MGRFILFSIVFFSTSVTATPEEHNVVDRPRGYIDYVQSPTFRSSVTVIPITDSICVDGQYYHDTEGTVGLLGPCVKLSPWKGLKVSIGVAAMFGPSERTLPALTNKVGWEHELTAAQKVGIEVRFVYGFGDSIRLAEEHTRHEPEVLKGHHNVFFEIAPSWSYKGYGVFGVAERYHHREIEIKGGVGVFKQFKKFPSPYVEVLWPGKPEYRGGIQQRFDIPWLR